MTSLMENNLIGKILKIKIKYLPRAGV